MIQLNFKYNALACACAVMFGMQAHALEKLDDKAMSENTGEGLGFVLDDIRIVADPTTYIHVTSADSTNPIKLAEKQTEVLKDTSGNPVYKKGEIYMYGYSIGAENGSANSQVAEADIGTVDNPVVFSVGKKTNTADSSQFDAISIKLPKVANGNHPANDMQGTPLKAVTWVDVLPRQALNDDFQDPTSYLRMQAMANKFSLDGTEIHLFKTGSFDVGQAPNTGNANLDRYLRTEAERMKKAYSNKVANYGKLRINYVTDTDPATRDGLTKSGYFRWSVNQQTAGSYPQPVTAATVLSNQYGAQTVSSAPVFNDQEGLYVKDFQINMPLGSAFQPTIIDTNGNGSVTLEVTRIPNAPTVYEKHYANYVARTFNNVAKNQNTTLTWDNTKKELVEANGTYSDSINTNATGLTKQQAYCLPTNCPDTATHATAYFRTFTLDKNGEANPTANPKYNGYGVKGDASGFAGIDVLRDANNNIVLDSNNNTTTTLTTLAPNTAPTYNMAEGMVVNHLKITLNQ